MGAFNEDSRVKFPTIMHLMGMGYKYVPLRGVKSKYVSAEPVAFDPSTNILTEQFTEAFNRLNPGAEEDAANRMLSRIQASLLNDDLGRQFYREILLDTETRIIDLSSPANFIRNNTFQVATEMTCGSKDSDNYRPDITIFINGLPLAFIEVKKENNHEGIDAERNRMKARFVNPKFRRYLNITQIMVFSNDMEYDEQLKQGAYYATIGRKDTKYNCFREDGQTSFPIQRHFIPVEPEQEEIMLRDNNVVQYKSSTEYKTNCKTNTPTKRICDSLFSYERFYFLLKYGIAYADYPNGLQKHIMRYPQLFATKAIEQHLQQGENKGIIWHTQGSGKTALAFYNVKYLTDYYTKQGVVPQFFFIVDRIDLLIQAQIEFARRGLKVTSVNAKEDFAKIISSGKTTQNSEGKPEITVVNIQKFSNDSKALAKSAYNVKIKRIYFIDEAHRDYNPEGSFLKNLIGSDQDAIKIALTGTPIISREYNSKDIFGDYIHTYYYNASIADGYTLRLIREDIGSNFKVMMQSVLHNIRVKKQTVKEKDVYAHPNYVQPLLDYIIDDLAEFRRKRNDNTLAGMAVCNSKEQAQLMYRLFLENYADKSELDNERDDDGSIIYKSVSPDVIEVKKTAPKKGCYRAALILYDSDDKETRAKWIDLFKNGQVDLLIVYQMLQTGFDAPRLKKLYLHRMVKEHNLLQTLTRVNRPYKAEKFGYVVDFANIEDEYSKTNKDYQKELENEVGSDHISSIDKLFVTLQEAIEQVETASKVLSDYELTNPQIFSRQLNMVSDRDKVREILKSLESLRSLQNMLISQGSTPEVDEIIQVKDLHSLVKAARNRLDLLSFEENADDIESVKELLNSALETIAFDFKKKGEEQLELKEQYKQAVAHTRIQLRDSVDPQDPQYRSILEDFMSLFSKKDMEESNEFNMHNRVQNLESILKRIRLLNEQDQLRATYYNGDTKFVRVEKRLREEREKEERENRPKRSYAWTLEKQKVNDVLLLIKEDVDDAYFHNSTIVENDGYFKRSILTYVTRRFSEAQIASDRDARVYVGEVIHREYKVAN